MLAICTNTEMICQALVCTPAEVVAMDRDAIMRPLPMHDGEDHFRDWNGGKFDHSAASRGRCGLVCSLGRHSRDEIERVERLYMGLLAEQLAVVRNA